MELDNYIKGGTQKEYYEEADRENCNCLVCGADDYVVLDEEKGLSVVKCNNCGLIYTNPRAIDTEQNYFGEADIFFEEARLIFEGKKVHHRDRNYLYELKHIKKYKPSGKFLDIGTNMGFFLRKAREMGYDTEGVEPSPSLAGIATKHWELKIHNCFLEDADLPENSFDVITLIDVFEHVTNPGDILKKCNSLLKPDGIIAIKVPNGDYNHFKSRLAKRLGRVGGNDIWDCCEHVAHYTNKTMSRVCEQNGLMVKKAFTPLPIHSPVWAHHVGHYYQYPSPFILDWKRVILRSIFYRIGKMGMALRKKSNFSPDLMFIIGKK